MFWIIFIIIITVCVVNSKANKKETKFVNLLLQLREDENSDKPTIDAALTAHTLNKNGQLPSNTILQIIKEQLEKNRDSSNSTTNQEENTTRAYEELEGQVSLFAEEQTAQYMSPTPLGQGYTPPAPLGTPQPQQTAVPLENIAPLYNDSYDNQASNSPPNYGPAYTPMKPAKKPIELDPSSIVLILGVVLVLTSAIIFSTTIWDSVSSFAKMGLLVGLGMISFLISFAFYKRFDNKLPSTAFYFMGYTFVSFSVITFGFFHVSTDLTKMFVEVGWLFTMSFFTTLICLFSFYGYKIYRQNQFLWISLISTDVIIFTLSKACFDNVSIVLLLLAIYAVSLVYLLNFGKIDTDKSSIFDFSKVNLLIVSFVAVTVTQANIFTILICGILAGGYLISNDKQFNNDLSPILFCALMMTGLFKAGFGSSVSVAFMMLTFLPVMVFIFKSMKLLDDELQNKLNFVTLIACFFVFLTNTAYVLSDKPSIYSIITMIILFISISILNTTSYYKYIHPVLVTVIVSEITRYINYYDILDSRLTSFNVSLLLFGIFMFYTLFKKYNLNNYVSQNIFPLFLFITCLNTEYTRPRTSLEHIFTLYYISIVIACYIINAVNEKNTKAVYVYTTMATMFSVGLLSPVSKLVTIDESFIIAIFIFAIAVLLFYLKGFAITSKFITPINIVYLFLAQVKLLATLDYRIFYQTFYQFKEGYDLIFLFVALITLYVCQNLIKKDNFTVRYIFPFMLTANSIIVIANNSGGNANLFFVIVTGLVAIAGVLVRPRSSFQLPSNIVSLVTILLFRLYSVTDTMYLLVVATILYYAYQLYQAYKSDEINESRNSYIFILLAVLYCVTPSVIITQLVVATATIGYLYLVKNVPNVNMLYVSIKICNVLLNMLLVLQALGYTKKEDLPLLILASLYSIIVSTLTSRENNIVSGFGVFSMYWIVLDSAYRMLSPITTDEIALAFPIFLLNTALYFSKYITADGFSRLTQKELFTKEQTNFTLSNFSINIPVSKIDYYSFVGIIGILALFFEGYPFYCFFMLALYFLNFTGRIPHDNALITGSIASFCLALLTQEFIKIPRLYQTEYDWLIITAFIAALYYIWREKINPTTYFIYKIVLVARLFLDIMTYKEVFDAIELGIGLILLLLYGLNIKRLRIVVMSITSILLLITYISFAFWNNSYWFAYLILTGIFLITLSIKIESKKRR